MIQGAPPLAWLKAETYLGLPVQEKALMWGAYYVDVVHVHEQPTGSNRGLYINDFLAYCGLKPGEPWCAAFQSYLNGRAGWNEFHSASCLAWLDEAHKRGWIVQEPKRGDLAVKMHTPTAGHMVRATAVHETTFLTIEGNSNNKGSREGYEACRLERPIEGWTFFRPW